jgi:hypothetical protein
MRVFMDAIILRERSKHYELIVLPHCLWRPSSRNGTAQTRNNNKHNPLKAAHTIHSSENITKIIDAFFQKKKQSVHRTVTADHSLAHDRAALP